MGPEDPNIQVDNNVIGEYVDTLLEKGVIKSTQQDELINLLRIRFAQGPMDPRIAKMRNSAYLLQWDSCPVQLPRSEIWLGLYIMQDYHKLQRH